MSTYMKWQQEYKGQLEDKNPRELLRIYGQLHKPWDVSLSEAGQKAWKISYIESKIDPLMDSLPDIREKAYEEGFTAGFDNATELNELQNKPDEG